MNSLSLMASAYSATSLPEATYERAENEKQRDIEDTVNSF